MSPLSFISKSLLLGLVFSLTVSVTCSQITNVTNDQSTPIPGVGHDYIKLLSETVNPANGSVSLRLSVPVPKGRGLSIPFGFAYDSLNRISTAQSSALSGSDCWAQSFGYDPWGNLLTESPTRSGCPMTSLNIGVNTKNQIMNSGFSYDAAGNLLADGTNNYAYDAESYIKTLNGTGAAYTYDADGQRVYKQVASDTTEYVYLSGQPIAERKANGDWSDYIFVGPRRLARADTYEDRIHIFGTECSSCGSQYEQFTLGNIGNLAGHVVQQGDKLYLFQWQATGTRAGMNLHFSDGTETNGLVNDQYGNLIDADNVYQTWHYRRVDLSQFAGKTIAEVRLIVEGYTQPGRWDAYYHDISVVAADGTVYPLYARQTSISLSASGSSGMTGVGYEINHNGGAGMYPIVTTNYYHGDHLGSARLISSFNGYPVWSSTFLPYGQEWNQQSTVNHYKFTGKERDSESGLDNFGARYDSSQYGRFMSPDPANIRADVEDFTDPQGWNGYAYVRNNPLSLTDPDGLSYTVCIKDENDEQKCTTYNNDRDFWQAVHDSPGSSTRGNNDNGQILAGGKVVGTYDRIDVDLPTGVADMLHQTGMMGDAGVRAAMIATAPEYLAAAGGAAAVELAGQSSLTVFEGAEVAVKDHALRHLASDALKSEAKAAIRQAISSGKIRYISGGTFIGRVLIQGQQYVFTGAFQNGVAQIGRITEGIRDSLGRFLQ